jgi:hypothetical protein
MEHGTCQHSNRAKVATEVSCGGKTTKKYFIIGFVFFLLTRSSAGFTESFILFDLIFNRSGDQNRETRRRKKK